MPPFGKKAYIRTMVRKNGYNPKELASCYGKIRYITYEQAKKASDKKPEIVKPYKCKFCKYYHIGRKR